MVLKFVCNTIVEISQVKAILVASYASDHVLSIVVLDLSYETLSAKSTPHFYHPQGTHVPVANPSKDSEQVT